MKQEIIISLPSLIHRIGREAVKQAQLVAKQFNCELKRVRRSRNWGLTGDAMQIQAFSQHLKTQPLTVAATEFVYLIRKVDTALLSHTDKLEPLAAKLARLIAQQPNITLAELMHQTECTMAEARAARFDAEVW
ncbi:ribosome recycling factor family protein [Shewanella schlegeliana]|uniref:Ribosome recycling factor family protein n=1 Tax=Shewanella schlegeliana TaxID=190308 RepID=A0ABS1T0N0_9GAMM|nr:ribosome recycling factor family protein [Shewanella schlegeliana]MBL4914337.1 ribosome recycling factor family protein [Shewanella schlegeliana]MCL1109440.1 ribosome recycling factor family protein [Shewanella schlegeliana]GIU37266.1 ribosome recycling factor Rrf [Shewanella schlegeliana]